MGFLVILLCYHLAQGVLGSSRFYFRLRACKIRSQFPLCINMVGPSSGRLRICYLICNPTAIANTIFFTEYVLIYSLLQTFPYIYQLLYRTIRIDVGRYI